MLRDWRVNLRCSPADRAGAAKNYPVLDILPPCFLRIPIRLKPVLAWKVRAAWIGGQRTRRLETLWPQSPTGGWA